MEYALVSHDDAQLICWMGGNDTMMFGIGQVNVADELVMDRALVSTDLIKDWDCGVVGSKWKRIGRI